MFTCTHEGCRDTFKHAEQRRRHQLKCTKPKKTSKFIESDGKFKCSRCHKEYNHKQNAIRHYKSCGKSGPAANKTCKTCGLVFSTPFKMKRHNQSVHEKKKTVLECSKCFKIYSRRDHFEKHEASCIQEPLQVLEESVGQIDIPEQRSGLSMLSVSSATPRFTSIAEDSSASASYCEVPITSDDELCESLLETPSTPLLHSTPLSGSRLAEIGEQLKRLQDQNKKEMTDIAMKTELASSVLQYIKALEYKEMGREWCQKVVELIGIDNALNQTFIHWLCKSIGIERPVRMLTRIKHYVEIDFANRRGKTGNTSSTVTNLVYNEWINSSIPSVDRRNDREWVTISQSNYNMKYHPLNIDLHEEIIPSVRRNVPVYKAMRRITTMTFQMMKARMEKQHGFKVSIGMLAKCKPFFCQPPTEKEKSLCLCKICLNARQLFDALKSYCRGEGIELGVSMSDYFLDDCSCDKPDIGYYPAECCLGKCPSGTNKSKPVAADIISHQSPSKQVKYYQYEQIDEEYIAKRGAEKGQTKVSKRTERVNYTENVEVVIKKLESCRIKYLIHRFLVVENDHHWKIILGDQHESKPIFHMDFSENLQLTPKMEVQDAHFSKKQYSLHCTVKYTGKSSASYMYHLSDELGHDIKYVSLVVKDLLSQSPEAEIYRFRSDNCSVQYKCHWVFGFWRSLAQELQKPIVVYYGEPGHGKGTVDAMSGFGVKTPIRTAIVTKDIFFNSSEDVLDYLQNLFEADNNKVYKHFGADQFKAETASLKIKGCKRARMMSYGVDGTVQIKNSTCSCEKCLRGNFLHCLFSESNDQSYLRKVTVIKADSDDDTIADDSEVLIDDGYEDDEEIEVVLDERSVLAGSVVALFTPQSARELFFLCLVEKVEVVDTDQFDAYGHQVLKGDTVVRGRYLELKDTMPKKGLYSYRLHKKEVFIELEQIFCHSVKMTNQHQLEVSEYQFLSDCIY